MPAGGPSWLLFLDYLFSDLFKRVSTPLSALRCDPEICREWVWFRGRVPLVIDVDQDKLLYFMGLVCSQTCSRFVHRSHNELYQTAPNGVSGTRCLLFIVLSLISVTAVQHLELTCDGE